MTLQAQGEAGGFPATQAEQLPAANHPGQPLLTASGSDVPGRRERAGCGGGVTLAGLGEAQPDPKFRPIPEVEGGVTQKQNTQTITGQLALVVPHFTGQDPFRDFGSTMDVDVNCTPARTEIKKLKRRPTQNGNTRGDFALTGAFEACKYQTVQMSAKLSGFNQDGLRPFLGTVTGLQSKPVSIAVNGSASVQYATEQQFRRQSRLTGDQPGVPGNFPATPLAARLQVDTLLKAIRRHPPVPNRPDAYLDRAPNQLQLQGQVDFSNPKAVQGNLKLSSEGLDLTPYYDLFAGGASNPGNVRNFVLPRLPPRPFRNRRPAPPLHNFTLAADIGRLYLREVAITNFQTTVKMDGGHVQVKPFQLVLNGAPASASADSDLSLRRLQIQFRPECRPGACSGRWCIRA